MLKIRNVETKTTSRPVCHGPACHGPACHGPA